MTQGAIVVYDVTSRSTFNNIPGWLQSVTEHGSPNIRVAIVGHKCDLEDERSVENQEGQKVNMYVAILAIAADSMEHTHT